MVTRLLTTGRKYNKRDAEYALRNGAIAACILAAATTIFIIAGIAFEIVRDRVRDRGIYFGAWNFLDVFIILACALGMYRKSRVATVMVFVYFLISRLDALNHHFTLISSASLPMVVVELFFYRTQDHSGSKPHTNHSGCMITVCRSSSSPRRIRSQKNKATSEMRGRDGYIAVGVPSPGRICSSLLRLKLSHSLNRATEDLHSDMSVVEEPDQRVGQRRVEAE